MKNARDLNKLFYTVTCQRDTAYFNSDNTVVSPLILTSLGRPGCCLKLKLSDNDSTWIITFTNYENLWKWHKKERHTIVNLGNYNKGKFCQIGFYIEIKQSFSSSLFFNRGPNLMECFLVPYNTSEYMI